MDVGIGLPATIPGTDGKTVVEWAKRAEKAGFSSLGVIDRVVYQNYEPLVALAAAAAVTERIRLVTTVLLAPLRTNATLFAKQAASVDALSGGRLVLGLGLGARDDDYESGGLTMSLGERGAALVRMIKELRAVWGGEERGFAGAIGPAPVQRGGIPIVLGGQGPIALRRAARHGDGWIGGGGPPEMFTQLSATVDQAWKEEGRQGKPRKMALAYFALGPRARENADAYLRDYYGFAGPFADQIAAGAAVSEEMVRQYIAGFQQAGCDELIIFPCTNNLDQVDLLAQAVKGA